MENIQNWKKYLPGMRAVKTSIAVFLCVIVSSFSTLISPFFMALAAIITMQVSTVDSVKMGRMRILGTTIGASIGLMFALIGSAKAGYGTLLGLNLPWHFLRTENAFFCAIGVLVLIQICNRLHWNGSIQIATFVFLAIMVNMNGQDPVVYSVTRLLDTIIGVVIGVLVNYFVFPNNNLKTIHEQLHGVKAFINETADTKTGQVDIEQMRSLMLALRAEIELYRQEASVQRKQRVIFETYEKAFQLYWDSFEHFKHIKMVSEAIEEASVEDYLQYEALQIVYQFHWNCILKDLEAVNLPETF
jgi:uncharacterized membrane protein YgaE (UPF0421/DUF939 family)